MHYNDNECCIEATAEEICLLVSHPSDLDSPKSVHMNIYEKGFDRYLREMPDHNACCEVKNASVALINTAQVGGIYYTVRSNADRAYKNGLTGYVDRFVAGRKHDGGSTVSDFDAAIIKINSYFFAASNSLERVNARMVFCFKDNGKIKIVEDSFSFDELRRFYFLMLEKTSFFGRFAYTHKTEVIPSAKKVPFPYSSLRDGQEKMIKTVYRGICNEKKVFVQAPTGIGKTVSSLYGAIRAFGEERIDKVFYLTAKGSTAREAFSAMKKIFSAGARIKTVMIGSKDTMCLCQKALSSGEGEGNFCDSSECMMCRGYYDRRNAALAELLDEYNGYSQSIIKRIAAKYSVCPYELSLDLSEYCDVIICDYNYVFDPTMYFRRYFGEAARCEYRYAFLVDEAHNLFDRAVDMYSAVLSRNDFLSVAVSLPQYESRLVDALDSFIKQFDRLKRLCRDNMQKDEKDRYIGYYISKNKLTVLEKSINILCTEMNPWLRKNKLSPHYFAVKNIYSKLKRFSCIFDIYDDKFITFIEVFGGDIKYRLRCLDPSGELSICQNRAVSTALFSATLAPFDYYFDILGGAKGDIRLELESPFEKKDLCLAVYDSVSTKFEDRAKSYKKISSCIAAVLSGKAGNYIVYFPSYQYMKDVLCEFEKKYPYVTTVVQKENMTPSEKEQFIASFKNDIGVLRVGFCVLGGSFAEGIDLPGSRLIGTVIIGVGLPGISNERNIMKEYYDNTCEQGYDYAYTYPGFNRVLQAVGRVIRSENDRGIAVLIDDRYATEKYKNIFPVQWNSIKYSHNVRDIAEIVKNFWNFEGKDV